MRSNQVNSFSCALLGPIQETRLELTMGSDGNGCKYQLGLQILLFREVIPCLQTPPCVYASDRETQGLKNRDISYETN